MKTLNKTLNSLTAVVLTASALAFSACTEHSPMQTSTIPAADEITLSKWSPRGLELANSALVYPEDKAQLGITGEGLVSATFTLKNLHVSKPTVVRLEKLGVTENAYRLSPAGLKAEKIEIVLEFHDDRIIPSGATVEDLRLFQIVNGSPQELETKVKAQNFDYNKEFTVEIKAKAYETGEFVLGASVDGEFKQANGLNFLSMGKGVWQLGDELQVRGWISQKDGGELLLKHEWYREDGEKVKVTVSLEFEKDSIDRDAEFILNFDQEYFMGNLDVVFNPHGVVFKQPAILNIKAEGLDLSGVDPEGLGLFYDNQETGDWEPMKFKKLKVEPEKGKIELKDAELPHFSRYALAGE